MGKGGKGRNNNKGNEKQGFQGKSAPKKHAQQERDPQPPRMTQKQMKKEERSTRARMRSERNANRYGDAEWTRDFEAFQKQMNPLGLTIKDVAGDGNCLFRAIADQLEGDPTKHATYRKKICEFIQLNREEYEPFIEDDETFDSYLKEMKSDGSWGGQMEIQAASLTYMINITIHQLGTPRWDIVNFPPNNKTIHLSYHLGAHYSSVRLLGDPTLHSRVPQAAPKEIKIVDKSQPKKPHSDPEPPKPKGPVLSEAEYTIMEITGCSNEKFVHQLFIENFGDMNACVEFILMIGPDDYEFQREFLQEKKGGSSAPKPVAVETHTAPRENPSKLPKAPQPYLNKEPNHPNDEYVHPKLQKFYNQPHQSNKEKQQARQQDRNGPQKKGGNGPVDVIDIAEINLPRDLGSMQI